MSEDLITNAFTENVNLTLIRRNQIIVKALLSLCTLYCLLDILNWYFILKTSDNTYAGDFLYLYTLRIRPTVSVLILMANLCSFYFMAKANDLVAASIHQENAAQFNEGYRFYFRANMLFLCSSCVAIISVTVRIVIRY